MKYLKKYKFKFKCMTPIHIGSGEKISIFDYKVRERQIKAGTPRGEFDYFLCVFDHAKIYHSLNEMDKQKFISLSKSDRPQDITSLREMIAEHAKENEHYYYKTLAHKAFYEHYENKKGALNNQCGLNLFARNGFIPYIPGSSIKGAIRTGIMNSLFNACDGVKTADIKNNARGNGRYAEFSIMNALSHKGYPDIEKDPFGGLLVSDISLANGDIYACKLLKYRYSEKNKIIDVLSNQKNQSGMELNFELAKTQDKTLEIIVNSKKFNIGHDILTLLEHCDKFSKRVLIDECERLFKHNDSIARDTPFKPSEIAEAYQNIKSGSAGEGKFLLRVGFSGGYDATTIKKIRNFPEPKPGKMGMGWGYSKNLFKKYPLGFVLLEFESEE